MVRQLFPFVIANINTATNHRVGYISRDELASGLCSKKRFNEIIHVYTIWDISYLKFYRKLVIYWRSAYNEKIFLIVSITAYRLEHEGIIVVSIMDFE